MPTKKSAGFDQREYVKAYAKEHIVYRKASFNDQSADDQRLLAWIDAQPESTSAYLKRLVLEDLTKGDYNDSPENRLHPRKRPRRPGPG